MELVGFLGVSKWVIVKHTVNEIILKLQIKDYVSYFTQKNITSLSSENHVFPPENEPLLLDRPVQINVEWIKEWVDNCYVHFRCFIPVIEQYLFSFSLLLSLTLCQPVGHAVLSDSSQQLVLVLSVSVSGPGGLPRLCGRHHLLLHLADLPPSSRGQYGGQRAVRCHAGVDSRCCLHHENSVFFTG